MGLPFTIQRAHLFILKISAAGDGLKSDNDQDPTRGYILIENGYLDIVSDGDAITAETDALIMNGTITLNSGGGGNRTIFENLSAKGVKAVMNTIIDKGIVSISSADDALH